MASNKPLNRCIAAGLVAYGVLACAGTPFFGVTEERPEAVSAPDSAFFDGKERGWFWYEREPVPEPLPEQPPAPPAAKKPDGPKPLSSAWFKKNLGKFRDAAVDNPTPENVSRYMYLQRVMLDKAETFTDAVRLATIKDPILDENSRRPIATFGGRAMDESSDSAKAEVAKKLAGSTGLWFFFSSTCNFCVKEAGVLKGLQNAYGFKVLPISLDGLPLPGGDYPDFTADQGQAKRLGVETTPALFLVKSGEGGGYIQLAQGLLSGDEIILRAIALAREQGWISDRDSDATRPVKPLRVDATAIQGIDDNTLSDPDRFVQAVRDHLRHRQ